MKKRWLAVLLAATMCLSLLATFAAAEDTPQLWFRTMEETESGTYAVTDTYLSALSLTFEEELCGVFYYGTLESREPVKEEHLSHTSTVRIRALNTIFLADTSLEGYAARMDLVSIGDEFYVEYQNIALPVSPGLPDVGFYKSDKRDLDNYLYDETLGYGPTSYLLLDEGCVIKEIIMDEGEDCSFLHFELSADNTMATLTMTEGFSTTARYNLTVVYTVNGEENVQYLYFNVEDLSTPYLKAYHVNRTNGVNWVSFSNAELSIEGALDDNDRWAVYFVNGYEETPVAVNDLEFPSVVEVQQQEEHESFFRLYYIAPTGAMPKYIEYAFDGEVYHLPVTIDLPLFSFYSEPNASIENYVGNALPFEGSNTDENGNVYDEYYLVSREGDNITGIKYEDGEDMSFLTFAEPDGTSDSVKFTVREGFESDLNYSFQVFWGSNDDEWINLSVQDMRAQLFMSGPDTNASDLMIEASEKDYNTSYDLGLGNICHQIFYFGTPDDYEKIPLDALKFSGKIEIEVVSADQMIDGLYGYIAEIRGADFGFGTVSYTVDGKTYSVSFDITLPNFAIYSEDEASENSYLKELVYDGSPTDTETFYVICTNNSYTITDITGRHTEDFMVFTPISASCWKLELSEGFDSGDEYQITVTYQRSNGTTKTNRLYYTVLDMSPSLTFRRLIWDGEQYTADDASAARYGETLSTIEPIRGVFYYGSETAPQPVKVSALTFNGVTATAWSNEDLDNTLGGYAVELFSDQAGKATVSYEGLTFAISVTEREYEGDLGYDGGGFYTSLDKEACIKVDDASGYPGDPVNLYFLWDEEDGTPDKITVTLRAQKEGYVFEDLDISDPDTIAALKDYDIYLTMEEDHVRLNTTIGNPRWLEMATYYGEDRHWEPLELNLKYYQWGNRQDNPTITIDGEDYTFGIGRIEDDDLLTFLDAGSGFGGDFCFSIVTGYDTNKQQPVNAQVYNEILEQLENLKFSITDYYNLVGAQVECNLSLGDIELQEWNGYNLRCVEIISTRGMGVETRMEVTFTYDGEDYCIVYRPCEGVDLQSAFYVDASDLNTADALNKVLNSKSALMSWFEAKDPAAYNTYKNNFATGMIEMAEIILKLPAVKYENIITVSVPGVDLTLRGHASGTTMPGLRILRNRYPVYVENINFVDVGLTHGKENPFTCGVLAARAVDINSSAAGDARIMDCTFTGFDYGVRSTEGGYATLNGPCQFFDCGVGYLLDTQDKGGGNGSEGMEDCIFANCGTAVQFLSLHDVCSPYYWRISHCDFINNHKDFDISVGGNFYFFRNYYGHFRNGVHKLHEVTSLDDIQYKKPQVVNNKGTTVFTNPRRVSPYNILDGWKDDTLRVDNGRETPEGVIVITENYLPNDETDNLVMDSALLSEEVISSGESINLSIIDEDEEVQATWTIN